MMFDREVDPIFALQEWLSDSALPFWAEAGVDPAGGFFERLAPDGTVIDLPRRARVVARQIYVYAEAERLGWQGPARTIVRHGLDFLRRYHLRAGGTVISSVSASGAIVNADFDLYDYAFVLFALAAVARIGEDADEMASNAKAIRETVRAGWQHPLGGFEENRPRSLPLKANPHMHLLEAALAWSAMTEDAGWKALVDEVATLALSRFVAADTGAVHEYFDGDWKIMQTSPLDVVEPGHQFEWAWLLSRWGAARGSTDVCRTVETLMHVAECAGVSKLGLAVNELNCDLTVRDGRHRLWPQTERLRAVHARAGTAHGAQVRQTAAGILSFFEHPIRGMWWEHLDIDGRPVWEPTRASSLYHIMSAYAELGRPLG